MTTYKIVRMYQNDAFPSEVVATGLSLVEARCHCKLKETSSRTCVEPENVKRTEKCGPWFDGYEED